MRAINFILLIAVFITGTPCLANTKNIKTELLLRPVAHVLIAEQRVSVVRNHDTSFFDAQGELFVHDTLVSSAPTQVIFTDNTSLTLGAGTELSIDDVQPGLVHLGIRRGIVRVVPGSAGHQVVFSTPHATLQAQGAALLLPVVTEAQTTMTMIPDPALHNQEPAPEPSLRVKNTLTGTSSVLSAIKAPGQSVQLGKDGTRIGMVSAEERGYLHSALRPPQVSFQGQSAGSLHATSSDMPPPVLPAKASAGDKPSRSGKNAGQEPSFSGTSPLNLASLAQSETLSDTLGSLSGQSALLTEIASFSRANYVHNVSDSLLQTELAPSRPVPPIPEQPALPPDLPPLIPTLPDPVEPPSFFPLEFKNLAAEYQGNLVGADPLGNEIDGDFRFKLDVQSGLIEHIGLQLRAAPGMGEDIGADAAGAWQIALGDTMFTFDVASLPLYYLFDLAPNEESALWMQGSISPDGQEIHIEEWLHDAYDKNAFKDILGSGQGQGLAVK